MLYLWPLLLCTASASVQPTVHMIYCASSESIFPSNAIMCEHDLSEPQDPLQPVMSSETMQSNSKIGEPENSEDEEMNIDCYTLLFPSSAAKISERVSSICDQNMNQVESIKVLMTVLNLKHGIYIPIFSEHHLSRQTNVTIVDKLHMMVTELRESLFVRPYYVDADQFGEYLLELIEDNAPMIRQVSSTFNSDISNIIMNQHLESSGTQLMAYRIAYTLMCITKEPKMNEKRAYILAAKVMCFNIIADDDAPFTWVRETLRKVCIAHSNGQLLEWTTTKDALKYAHDLLFSMRTFYLK